MICGVRLLNLNMCFRKVLFYLEMLYGAALPDGEASVGQANMLAARAWYTESVAGADIDSMPVNL